MPTDEVELSREFYSPWEIELRSWKDLQDFVNDVIVELDQHKIVWRGSRRASWGLTTSLYRALNAVLDRPPSEDEMVRAEINALRLARRQWRFDQMSALELFAHIQHFGGPTRLLDVSANPLIASWFAVERDAEDDMFDGRVFAFTAPRHVALKPGYNGRYPRWHDYTDDRTRRDRGWGTGYGRRLWRPPSFNDRIPAQNSAFIIDGVPLPDAVPPRLGENPLEKWELDRLRQISSFNFRPSNLAGTRTQFPIFTARIAAGAKAEIRKQIEDRYGYSASSLYSDLGGLASFLARRSEVLLDITKSR